MKDGNFLTDAPQSLTAKINKEKLKQFKGSESTLGFGEVCSWITVNKENGMPSEIGI